MHHCTGLTANRPCQALVDWLMVVDVSMPSVFRFTSVIRHWRAKYGDMRIVRSEMHHDI